jgi:peptidoglycan biosynthesis protein MviN/MurJ (putative lipid II flippase)
MDVVELGLAFALDWILTYRILRRDFRRMSALEWGRSWGEASLWSALFLCQRWCLVVHFTRTRRSWLGFLTGFGWALLVTAVLVCVTLGFEMVSE